MRRRILLLTLSTTFVVVLAFVVPLAVLVRSQVTDNAVRVAQDQAQGTAFFVRSLGSGPGSPLSGTALAQLRSYVSTTDADHHLSTLVRLADGTTVGALPGGVGLPAGAPAGGGTAGGGAPGGGGPGGSGGGDQPPQPVSGGRLLVAGNPDGTLVAVFLADSRITSGTTGWYLLLLGGSLLLLAVAAGAAVVVSRRISAPLTATAEAAHRLSVGDIGARAPAGGPREVAEVATALNRLAGRIDELIGEERETVADLSHRLRTPLTALRLDADTLHDPAESERIGGHVAALERTLTAVIRAARRPEREGLVPACDAAEVVRERVGFWSALAEDQGRDVTPDLAAGPLPVRAAAADLAAAVDALLENVLAHTPEGVAFRVALDATADGAELVVADAGPGIPEGAGARGRSDRGSTGLGLSIAARCAENSGGRMAVERPPGGGGVVRLSLGRP